MIFEVRLDYFLLIAYCGWFTKQVLQVYISRGHVTKHVHNRSPKVMMESFYLVILLLYEQHKLSLTYER